MAELHDPPSAAQLIEAVREWLEREVMASTEGRLKFNTRVAVNVLAMVERQLDLADDHRRDHAARLASLGMDDDRELAAAIRSGRLDDRIGDVRRIVRADVVDKVRVANPDYLLVEDR